MTAREIAYAVGVNERTVRRAIADGRLGAVKQGRRFNVSLDEARVVFARRHNGSRYQEALAEALHLLRAFGYEADALCVERDHGLVFVAERARVFVA